MKKFASAFVLLIVSVSVFAETYYYSIGDHRFHGGSLDTENCYSGIGEYQNSPNSIDIKDNGPIPTGKYTIRGPVVRENLGHPVFELIPDSGNEMFGRKGFLIHGDDGVTAEASKGCIILRGADNRRKIVPNSILYVTE
jgi:hypothetical protein